VGSGLLLADDGVGLPGLSAQGALPWWDMKLGGYVFQPSNRPFIPNVGVGHNDSLMIYGASLEVPSEGVWQVNQMFERELNQNQELLELGTPVSRAVRSFTSIHYQISYGPLFFEGEAAMEKGAATPTGAAPATNHITYNGNAEIWKAKWRQPMFHGQEGI